MTSVGFTRPRERIPEAIAQCKAFGFEAIGAPSLDVVHGEKAVFEKARYVLEQGAAYFTVFGSITAAEECVKEFGEDLLRLLERTNVACTGPSTAGFLLRNVGRTTDVVPEVYSGVGIAQAIAEEAKGKTVLLLRSDSGDGKITEILESHGATVLDAAVYGMVPAPVTGDTEKLMDAVASDKIDAMLFTSPQSAKTFLDQLSGRFGKEKAHTMLAETFKVAIGKPTADAMDGMGIPPEAVPEKSTFVGMLECIGKRPF